MTANPAEELLPCPNVHFSSASDDWSTPVDVYDALNAEFHFDFDPCPLHGAEDTVDNGLHIEWGKSNFVNPPYSDLKVWCKKAYEQAQLGKTVVMLIPSRTDTAAWHDYCMKAKEIRFIRGRLKFGDATNSAPFPSAIVIFDTRAALPIMGDAIDRNALESRTGTPAIPSPTPAQPSSLVEALEDCVHEYGIGAGTKFVLLSDAIAIVRRHESAALSRVDDEMVERVAEAIANVGNYDDWKNPVSPIDIRRAVVAIAALTTPDQPINNQPKGE